MNKAVAGLALLLLFGGTTSAALANSAHHPNANPGQANPAAIAIDGSATGVSAPTAAATPDPAADLAAASLPPGVTEVPISDSADLGVSIQKDARQPSLFDLMMRVMNLMLPHMKEMMGGVPAPDPRVAPNLVVDLDNPMGVKSNSKATPQTGGSGSLIVTPNGIIDPVSANMGGMGAPAATPPAMGAMAAGTADPNQLRQQLAAVVAEIAALNKRVAQLAELLGEAQSAPPAQAGLSAPGLSTAPAQPAPPAAPSPVPPPAPDSGTRIEL